MLPNETGYFHVVITASYREPNNNDELIEFVKVIYLHIWEKTVDPIKVIEPPIVIEVPEVVELKRPPITGIGEDYIYISVE